MLLRKWLHGQSISPKIQVPLKSVADNPVPTGQSEAVVNNDMGRGVAINGHYAPYTDNILLKTRLLPYNKISFKSPTLSKLLDRI